MGEPEAILMAVLADRYFTEVGENGRPFIIRAGARRGPDRAGKIQHLYQAMVGLGAGRP